MQSEQLMQSLASSLSPGMVIFLGFVIYVIHIFLAAYMYGATSRRKMELPVVWALGTLALGLSVVILFWVIGPEVPGRVSPLDRPLVPTPPDQQDEPETAHE